MNEMNIFFTTDSDGNLKKSNGALFGEFEDAYTEIAQILIDYIGEINSTIIRDEIHR